MYNVSSFDLEKEDLKMDTKSKNIFASIVGTVQKSPNIEGNLVEALMVEK